MERLIFEPTGKQLLQWSAIKVPVQPTDDEFRAAAKKARRPWGLVKRDWILGSVRCSAEYQRGLWQGRVDKARGLAYSEERSDKSYNLGYHLGYTEYESNRRGWDEATRTNFDQRFLVG